MTGLAARTWWRRGVPVAIAGLLLLGFVVLSELIVEMASPPGVSGHHDLLAFWSAGRLILDGHPGELYDAAALTAIQRAVIAAPIGMNGYMPFINPPAAAALFAPLASLPEPLARAAWAVANGALAVAAAWWLTRDLAGRERLIGTALVASSYPVIHALAEGQWSIILLVAGLAAVAAARAGRWGVAGAALAVLWLKPQFIALPLLALLLARRWRAVAVAIGAGVAAAAVALPWTGLEAYGTYLGYLMAVVTSHFSGAGAVAGAAAWHGDLASTEGLNGLLVGWFGQGSVGAVNVAWAVLSIALLGTYGLAARRVPPGFDEPGQRLTLAAGIAVIMLVNPNQFVQDCVLIFVALEALGGVGSRLSVTIVAAFVAVADLTFLDLQVPTPHLFTLVALGAVLWTCRAAVVDRSAGIALGSA